MPATIVALDIGTTSLKLLLIDGSNGKEVNCIRHEIRGKSHTADQRFELQPLVLLEDVCSVLKKAASDVVSIESFLLSGQMHGVMMWNSSDPLKCSNYVTWQDKRCTDEFLRSLPEVSSDHIVKSKTGFGLATLLWWLRHEPEYFSQYDCCGTICDWLSSTLCNCWCPMSTQMAASWGYYNMNTTEWDCTAIAKEHGFPMQLLPKVVQPGTVVGNVCSQYVNCQIPNSCNVYVALGDLQCVVFSVYSELNQNDAFINFGTSAQLGFLCNEPDKSDKIHQQYPSVECFPYFHQNFRIILAASLNGGDVLTNFVKLLCDWTQQLAPSDANWSVISEQYVWQRLDQLANDCTANSCNDTDAPVVQPRIFGERSVQQQLNGSVQHITPDNCKQLGIVYQALCSGLVNNLLSLCPLKLLLENEVSRIGLAGTAVHRNAVLCTACYKILAPLHCHLLGSAADAANGLVLQYMHSKK